MGVQLPNFKEFIEQAYRIVTFATRPGVAAWRFPPHSLAANTFRLLFSLFATPGILIEGFGAGTSFSAAAGLIALMCMSVVIDVHVCCLGFLVQFY